MVVGLEPDQDFIVGGKDNRFCVELTAQFGQHRILTRPTVDDFDEVLVTSGGVLELEVSEGDVESIPL